MFFSTLDTVDMVLRQALKQKEKKENLEWNIIMTSMNNELS